MGTFYFVRFIIIYSFINYPMNFYLEKFGRTKSCSANLFQSALTGTYKISSKGYVILGKLANFIDFKFLHVCVENT